MKKHAICNELFGEISFAQSCFLLQKHGYGGMEIAPFTLSDDPRELASSRVGETRLMLEDHGLEFAGLHWLFVKPEGLHITTPDEKTRRRSWDHLKRLVDLAGRLGGGSLVLGSPKQRNRLGIPREQAVGYLEEGLRSLADFTACRNSACALMSSGL